MAEGVKPCKSAHTMMMKLHADMCGDLSKKDALPCSDDMRWYDYLTHERVKWKIEERKRERGQKIGKERNGKERRKE